MTLVRRLLTILPATLIALCSASPVRAQGDVFSEPLRVWPVRLALEADEYQRMQPKAQSFWPRPQADRPAAEEPGGDVHRNDFGVDLAWVKGTAELGGASFPNIGIRYKGNGTIGDARNTAKKSLKLGLDRFGEAARLEGRKTINLHCGVTDPSKSRETLGYWLYRSAGVPAPRTTLAEVRLTVPGTFDGELLGIYTMVEEVDKPFLRAAFGTDEGLLMKPERLRDFRDLGDDWNSYEPFYRPSRTPTPEESARLMEFAKLVHQADDQAFAQRIEAYLDVDAYLRFLAVTAYLANSDSFFVLGHNYYLYLVPSTGRLQFIPWDLDRAFGNFPILGSRAQEADLSLEHPYPGEHLLTDRLLAMPGGRDRYRALLRELVATCLSSERLSSRLKESEAAVANLRALEATTARARNERPTRQNAPDLAQFLERRAESVAAQLNGDSEGFVPTSSRFPFFGR